MKLDVRKTILILGATHLHRDPRVRRQIAALKDHDLIVSTLEGTGIEVKGVKVVEYQAGAQPVFMQVLRVCAYLLRAYDWIFWTNYNRKLYQLLRGFSFDMILMNDVKLLPIAVRLKGDKRVPIYLDLHEFTPGQYYGLGRLYKGFYDYLCRSNFDKVEHFSTVNRSLAALYKNKYGVDSTVIVNAPSIHDINPSPVNENDIQMVHHGLALRGRHLENMCQMMNYLSDCYSLHFYLVAKDIDYLLGLKKFAFGLNKRIYFHEAVKYEEIVSTINAHDIGVHLIPPTNLNNRFSLPNKFFEFAHARLAIAVGPTPDMKALVQKYNVGDVSADFKASSLAAVIGSWNSARIREYKNNTLDLKCNYCAEINEETIRNGVNDLLAI